jgi:transcriptional regulator with XRE-family HTH domain
LAKGIQDARYRDLIAKLAAARKEMLISQAQLATRLGTHQQFVSRFETGERRLDVIEFIDVARALRLDPIDLLRAL